MREVATFTRQLALMLQSGIPVVSALEILQGPVPTSLPRLDRLRVGRRPFLTQVAAQLRRDILAGRSLVQAMRQHPLVFDELYLGMVEAGEASGALDRVLLRTALMLERRDRIESKVRGALLYPAVVMATALGAVAVLIVFVIPTFEGMFSAADLPLPWSTRVVIGLADALQRYGWVLMVASALVVVTLRRFRATASGRYTIDRTLLRLPVLGRLQRRVAVARFTRSLGTLVGSGLRILEALDITSRSVGNHAVRDEVRYLQRRVASGSSLAAPLRESKVFPPMVVQMIHVAEQTGGLDEMLEHVAEFNEREVDAEVDLLLSTLEPLIIVGLGVLVGAMVVSMYLPIFDLSTTAP